MPTQLKIHSSGAMLWTKRIRNHNCMVPALNRIIIIKRSQMRMAPITNDLAINIPHPERSSNQPRIPMMIRCHAIIHMGHRGSPIGNPHKRLLISRRRVSHTHHHTSILTISRQIKINIMLRRKRNIFNQPLSRFLILFKLLNRGSRDCFRRLGSLILHIQIRPFKMNSKNLCPFISAFHHSCHISNRLCQHIRHLGHSSRKDGSHSLFRYPSHPFPQSFRFPIVGIITISSMGMNINKSRNNPIIPVILISRHLTIFKDCLNLFTFHLKLCRDELSSNPNPSALYYHNRNLSFLIFSPAYKRKEISKGYFSLKTHPPVTGTFTYSINSSFSVFKKFRNSFLMQQLILRNRPSDAHPE